MNNQQKATFKKFLDQEGAWSSSNLKKWRCKKIWKFILKKITKKSLIL